MEWEKGVIKQAGLYVFADEDQRTLTPFVIYGITDSDPTEYGWHLGPLVAPVERELPPPDPYWTRFTDANLVFLVKELESRPDYKVLLDKVNDEIARRAKK